MYSPIFLICYYFQVKAEVELLEEYKKYLPEHLLGTVRNTETMLSDKMYKALLLALFFLAANYIS